MFSFLSIFEYRVSGRERRESYAKDAKKIMQKEFKKYVHLAADL